MRCSLSRNTHRSTVIHYSDSQDSRVAYPSTIADLQESVPHQLDAKLVLAMASEIDGAEEGQQITNDAGESLGGQASIVPDHSLTNAHKETSQL